MKMENRPQSNRPYPMDYEKSRNANRRAPQSPPPKRKSLMSKFFKTLLITLGVLVICSGVAVFAYNQLFGEEPISKAIARAIDLNLKDGGSIADVFSQVPNHTNFMILGTDHDGTRTDAMMVGTFNADTREISLVSIPRDTWVYMPEDRRQILKDQGRWTPSDGGMKINEVHHYAGPELGVQFAVKQAEELLDIQIPYYVKVDLDGFKFIVDEIGGVEYDVPEKMDWDDPYQDLYIHLKPGVQLLDGEHAMQLVRHRHYDSGDDFSRVHTQQQFLKALMLKILDSDHMMNNAMAIIKTMFNYVETNFPVTDAPKYLPYAKDISFDSIRTYTIPGDDGWVGSKSVVFNDPVGTAAIIDEVFYASGGEDAAEEPSAGKAIQVLNGSYTSGLAAKNQDYLEENGFTVANIGDFSGVKTDYTRIYIKRKGIGVDIKALYPGSKLIVDPKIDQKYDIIVILGKDEL